MAAFNPFYRFAPATLNAGFAPEINRVSTLLNGLYSGFATNDQVGNTIGQAIKDWKNAIATFNQTALDGGFVLVYPSPYPAISGTQTLTFYIRNPQSYGKTGQQIAITANLESGVVDSNAYSDPGAQNPGSNYEGQLLAVENRVIEALGIVDQSGAAFFPLEYNFAGNVAYSGLVRGRNWLLVQDGNPVPDPEVPYPFQPARLFSLRELTPDERYVVGVINQVINFAIVGERTASEIDDKAGAFTLPTDWVYDFTQSGDFIELNFWGPDSAFKLVGSFIYDWKFQRFFTPAESDESIYITGAYSGDPLPFEPQIGIFWPAGYYDFDFCQFQSCPNPNDETYQPPIKPGDLLQFNILPTDANLTGVTSAKLGILDENGVFKGQVGEALSACNVFAWGMDLAYPDNVPFCLFITNPGDLNVNSSLYFLAASVPVGPLVYTIDILNSWAENLTIGRLTFEPTGTGYSVVWDLGMAFDYNVLAGATNFIEVPPFPFADTIEGSRCCGAQFRATVTVPSLPDGCYQFCLYNDSYNSELYAVSQLLRMDSADCFSSILEYWGEQNGVTEGFEYYGNWKQRVRVDLNGGGETVKIEESVYRGSDGVFRRPNSATDKVFYLHSEYIDLDTQNALISATRHEVFVLNGLSLFVEGDIEVATLQDFTTQSSYRKLAQVKFQAQIQGYQPPSNPCIGC